MSYILNLRKKAGSQKLLYPGARIIMENEKGEFLFIKRGDNGNWGLPAGGLEENETIRECIYREVKEETGLDLTGHTFIGLSSNPQKETVHYPNGDVTQYLVSLFYSNSWKGIPTVDGEEVESIQFFPREMIRLLPPGERHSFHFLDYYRKNGEVWID